MSCSALQLGDETKIQVPDKPAAKPAAAPAKPEAPAAPAAARAAPPQADAAAAAVAAEAKRKAALEEAKAKMQKEQVGFDISQIWNIRSNSRDQDHEL